MYGSPDLQLQIFLIACRLQHLLIFVGRKTSVGFFYKHSFETNIRPSWAIWSLWSYTILSVLHPHFFLGGCTVGWIFNWRSFSAPSCSAAQPETAVQIAKGLLCIADVSQLHPSFPPSLGQLWTQMCVSRVRNGSGGAVGPRPPPGQLQPGKLHLPSDAAQHRQDCFRI